MKLTQTNKNPINTPKDNGNWQRNISGQNKI